MSGGALETRSCPKDELLKEWLMQVKQSHIQQAKTNCISFNNYLENSHS